MTLRDLIKEREALHQLVRVEFNVRRISKKTQNPEPMYRSGYRVKAVTYSDRQEEIGKIVDAKDLKYKPEVSLKTNLSIYVFPELKDAASEIVNYLTALPKETECREYAIVSAPVDAHIATPLIHRVHFLKGIIREERRESSISEQESESVVHQINELYTHLILQK